MTLGGSSAFRPPLSENRAQNTSRALILDRAPKWGEVCSDVVAQSLTPAGATDGAGICY